MSTGSELTHHVRIKIMDKFLATQPVITLIDWCEDKQIQYVDYSESSDEKPSQNMRRVVESIMTYYHYLDSIPCNIHSVIERIFSGDILEYIINLCPKFVYGDLILVNKSCYKIISTIKFEPHQSYLMDSANNLNWYHLARVRDADERERREACFAAILQGYELNLDCRVSDVELLEYCISPSEGVRELSTFKRLWCRVKSELSPLYCESILKSCIERGNRSMFAYVCLETKPVHAISILIYFMAYNGRLDYLDVLANSIGYPRESLLISMNYEALSVHAYCSGNYESFRLLFGHVTYTVILTRLLLRIDAFGICTTIVVKSGELLVNLCRKAILNEIPSMLLTRTLSHYLQYINASDETYANIWELVRDYVNQPLTFEMWKSD